ncbi:mesotocin receptor-like [Mytilus galloprovincialis]|uniref:mesotocin receptor-like n=1 Tax=Mytilus trossulus TaxID=6551 RepID=UPI0030046DB8
MLQLKTAAMSSMNISDNNSFCGTRGVMINFPIEWEIAKWIRCTEFVVTVVLNVSLCILLQKKGKKSNLVLFVFHLVLSDIAVAVFHIFPLIINHFFSNWMLGLTMCKLKFYLSNVSLFASTYLIVTIAVDRLLCVLHPLAILRQRRRYKTWMITIPWGLSFLVNIPILVWTKIFTICECNICTPDLRGIREIALLLNAAFLLFIPSLVLILCYSTIMFFICQKLQIKHGQRLSEIGLIRQATNNCRCRVFSKANRRSTIMTFVVSITFIVCWMPFILAGLLNLYGDLGYGGWFDILIALAPLNSMVNPIIFLTFNNRTFISRRKSTFRRADQLELMNIS